MSTELKMTINERYKYLRMMQVRYRQANKSERSRLLDEMEMMTGCHRKSLIRQMKSDLRRKKRRKQRSRTYGVELHAALKVIAESYDHICAERLQPNLVAMAEHLAAHGELRLPAKVSQQLGQISVSTVHRILVRLEQDQPRLPQKGPERANQLARQVPMERIAWHETEPGHFEVDMVHHCGPTSTGQFVHTLQMIDVTSGWSERVATLGRSYLVMADGFERILSRLPFAVLEIHTDNGSEFLNYHLLRYFSDRPQEVAFTRSRPYKKNDNAHVEQKNWTHVRQLFGYDRIEEVELIPLMNDLYANEWSLYQNHFCPGMKLVEKQRINSRYKKRYDAPKTPYQRLLDSAHTDEETKNHLRNVHKDLNPFILKQGIEKKLKRIFRQIKVTSNVRQRI